MAIPAALPLIADAHAVRSPPRPPVLWAIASASLAAAACTVLLALTSDHIREPGIHAALQVWPMLGYVLAGVVACARVRKSRRSALTCDFS